jgi:hypothetical protein
MEIMLCHTAKLALDINIKQQTNLHTRTTIYNDI